MLFIIIEIHLLPVIVKIFMGSGPWEKNNRILNRNIEGKKLLFNHFTKSFSPTTPNDNFRRMSLC